MYREAWHAAVHGVTKSWTQLGICMTMKNILTAKAQNIHSFQVHMGHKTSFNTFIKIQVIQSISSDHKGTYKSITERHLENVQILRN